MLNCTFNLRKRRIVVTGDRYRLYNNLFCCAILTFLLMFYISAVNYKLGLTDVTVIGSPSKLCRTKILYDSCCYLKFEKEIEKIEKIHC